MFFGPQNRPKRSPGQHVDPGRQSMFRTFTTVVFTGSWHAPDKVRLEKRVPLLRISLGDLPICPFGGQKPFSTQPNQQIQDWGFSKILALQEPVVCAEDKPAVSAEENPVECAEEKPVVSAEDKPVVSADKKSAVCQDIPTPLSTQGRPPLYSQCLGDVMADCRFLVCRHNRFVFCRHDRFLFCKLNRFLFGRHSRFVFCTHNSSCVPRTWRPLIFEKHSD